MRALLVLAFALSFPTIGFAHTGHAGGFDLVQGFAHPIGGVDHVLAMIAVGVLGFVLGGRALVLVPLSFLAMMAAGFVLGAYGVAIPFVEFGIAVSSIAIGGAAALGKPIPTAGAMALVGVFAVFHGHAHGTEMSDVTMVSNYAIGLVAATALLHLSGMVGATMLKRLLGHHSTRAIQMISATLALGGLGVLLGWI